MNESELLFTEVLKCSRQELYLNRSRRLNLRQSLCLAHALKRRMRREPIQYILGRTEFMGLEFSLTPEVFIPRPETEILVETALKFSCQLSASGCRLKILDIGTGSGCIAISLARLLEDAEVDASEISKQALEVAKKNAGLNNAGVNFYQSNLFPPGGRDYALIISNPPYIPTAEISGLAPEISYEPRIALDGGRDGLCFYRRIIQEAPLYLGSRGFLILEMGFSQCPEIKNLLDSSGRFEIIEVARDYQDIDRVIVARLRQGARNG
ncbi:peptide chain release factor N(5)-glutamine methyltransferase [Candidatus Omnitrophota bacterium]